MIHAQFSRNERSNDPGGEATCIPYTFTVCMISPGNNPQVIELLQQLSYAHVNQNQFLTHP